jgi:hypothetical protein
MPNEELKPRNRVQQGSFGKIDDLIRIDEIVVAECRAAATYVGKFTFLKTWMKREKEKSE